VQRVSFAPVQYTLGYINIWNTYEALSRWTITADGYLQTVLPNAYAELPRVDADGDGRVDHDWTVRFEVQDSGPATGVIYGIDSRTGDAVPLWQAPLQRTGDWLTADVTLHRGDFLTSQLTASVGMTFRAIGITAVEPP
jgi:hypothetical protein